MREEYKQQEVYNYIYRALHKKDDELLYSEHKYSFDTTESMWGLVIKRMLKIKHITIKDGKYKRI